MQGYRGTAAANFNGMALPYHWECQLKPKVRQQTLAALEYTLCHIYLEDRRIKSYETIEEEYDMVAESATEYDNKSE